VLLVVIVVFPVGTGLNRSVQSLLSWLKTDGGRLTPGGEWAMHPRNVRPVYRGDAGRFDREASGERFQRDRGVEDRNIQPSPWIPAAEGHDEQGRGEKGDTSEQRLPREFVLLTGTQDEHDGGICGEDVWV
jgi:hypothetical protein